MIMATMVFNITTIIYLNNYVSIINKLFYENFFENSFELEF
jgi:hypothetical protein